MFRAGANPDAAIAPKHATVTILLNIVIVLVVWDVLVIYVYVFRCKIISVDV